MARVCPHCGERVPPVVAFCPECHESLDDPPPEAVPATGRGRDDNPGTDWWTAFRWLVAACLIGASVVGAVQLAGERDWGEAIGAVVFAILILASVLGLIGLKRSSGTGSTSWKRKSE
jgi:hypothetical protein